LFLVFTNNNFFTKKSPRHLAPTRRFRSGSGLYYVKIP
jgi:hypothetical protein